MDIMMYNQMNMPMGRYTPTLISRSVFIFANENFHPIETSVLSPSPQMRRAPTSPHPRCRNPFDALEIAVIGIHRQSLAVQIDFALA